MSEVLPNVPRIYSDRYLLFLGDVILLLIFFGTLYFIEFYRKRMRFSLVRSYALWGIPFTAAFLWTVPFVFGEIAPMERSHLVKTMKLLSVADLLLYAVPSLIFLYSKWVGGRLDEEESLPTAAGFRAWLRPGNLFIGLSLGYAAHVSLVHPLPGMLLLPISLLCIYPLVNILFNGGCARQSQTEPASESQEFSRERSRVLRLLEEGKINAEEGKELINALTASEKGATRSFFRPITRADRATIVGVALLLIGFCLPWFRVNITGEMARMMEEMSFSLQHTGPDKVVLVSAGDIQNGLGWMILFLGAGAAILPFLRVNLDSETVCRIRFGALAVGGFLLLYLLSRMFSHASLGIFFVLGGYVAELLATARGRGPIPEAQIIRTT